jgi:HD-GYP domain-containing protein (c-di-GMP phosphodiesterase class II)
MPNSTSPPDLPAAEPREPNERDGLTSSWDDDGNLAARHARQLANLNQIGLALSAERDIDRLLETVLSISRELTGADAGSLFLVSKDQDGNSALYFREAQNDSMEISTKTTFTVGPASLAGYVALTGQPLCIDDVYALSPDLPYQFNPSADRQNGYRTKSVLVVPLRNRSGYISGVLQLINRKPRRDMCLSSVEITEREVMPFDEESLELAASIASQAAVTVQNSRLLTSIEELLESFVLASSSAIEDRDPSTSGHSQRVTALTLGLAQAANQSTEGPFADVFFSEQALKELRYAGLLHDFGKIGVRENILTKSHKLEPARFELVKMRLSMARLEACLTGVDNPLFEELFHLLERANDPAVTYLPDAEYAILQAGLKKLAALTYPDERGNRAPIIDEEECAALLIRKGSLTRDEYRQIQQHAALSYEFLRKIAWTADLERVPDIAHGHHEKLNGTGYPLGVLANAIPLQTRMMTIADIYDALTAADRPYKKAMPPARAMDILREEVAQGGLDGDVLDLFIQREVWKLTEGLSAETL